MADHRVAFGLIFGPVLHNPVCSTEMLETGEMGLGMKLFLGGGGGGGGGGEMRCVYYGISILQCHQHTPCRYHICT